MKKIALVLTVVLSSLAFSCSSDDGGMTVNDKDVTADFINTHMVDKSGKEYTSFNYKVVSTANLALDGRLELTTVKNEVFKSDYFQIRPNGNVVVPVLVEGKVGGEEYIKSKKVYVSSAKPITDPIYPKL